ncbi:MAG: hypothetical protein Q9193_006978 [Seirophora villosa]
MAPSPSLVHPNRPVRVHTINNVKPSPALPLQQSLRGKILLSNLTTPPNSRRMPFQVSPNLVLGEDETLPRNRLALICHKCRLVNGQAPPGAQRLEDVGKWRCIGCGTMNGEEKEETTLLKQIREHGVNPTSQPRDVRGKAALADASDSEGSGQEEMYEAGEDEHPSDTDSSGSEHKQDKTRGTASGVQKTANSPRRRSQRVQSKNGQGKKG